MGLRSDIGEIWWYLSLGKKDGGGGSGDETGAEAEFSPIARAVEIKKKASTSRACCARFAMNEGFGEEREREGERDLGGGRAGRSVD